MQVISRLMTPFSIMAFLSEQLLHILSLRGVDDDVLLLRHHPDAGVSAVALDHHEVGLDILVPSVHSSCVFLHQRYDCGCLLGHDDAVLGVVEPLVVCVHHHELGKVVRGTKVLLEIGVGWGQ